MICDKCEGKGFDPIPPGAPGGQASRCNKCQGHGKVDWVENIVGKKPEMNFGSSSTSMSSGGTFAVRPGMCGTSRFDLPKAITDEMAKRLADQIDKDILDTLKCEAEQSINQMKKASDIMAEMGGTVFDNRIISKFMLFFTTKPKVKVKENRGVI